MRAAMPGFVWKMKDACRGIPVVVSTHCSALLDAVRYSLTIESYGG